jgi:hypothetical protein
MKNSFNIFCFLIICSLFLISQETNRTVLFYQDNGNKLSFNFDEINSLKLELIDSLSNIHVFYINNHRHFIYSSIGLDSISFDHNDKNIIVFEDEILEEHNIDSIKCIKINCEKLLIIDDPENGFHNEDSVMVDSCQNPPVQLVQKWFLVVFDYYVIDLPEAPEDTILEVTWESISTSFTQLRSDFEEMENKFGGFILRKRRPQITDSTQIGSKTFWLSFDDYVIKDSVLEYGSKMSGLFSFYYINRAFIDI